jgi:phosphonate ABC transporter permease subunit PhnE
MTTLDLTARTVEPRRPDIAFAGRGASARNDRPLVIHVKGLCKTFKKPDEAGSSISALCGLNLDVPEGQHVAVFGASGSGKTTLLGCLSGRLEPCRGQVEVNRGVSTIHQDLRLVKQRTALRNVMDGALCRLPLWRSLIRFPGTERQRAVKLLERVGLAGRVNWPAGRLSGGEQQRVAIARSLMQDTKILLADEPVASLDERSADDVMKLFADLGREHDLTLVSVLHDRKLAQKHADRMIGLEGGRLIFDSDHGDGIEIPVAADDDADAPPVLEHAAPQHRPTPAHGSAWWRTGRFAALIGLLVLAYGLAVKALGVTPRHFEGVGTGLARFFADLMPGSVAEVSGIPWAALGEALLQTLGMSLIGTTLGVFFSWPLAALAARNVGPRGLRHVVRFGLNAVRTVPSLIWALMFVAAVGLGPLAGVLALTFYSVGYLTKFFYEEFEAVDPGPPSALAEIGAGGLQQFWFAVWPASKPSVLSSCLFMFEYNVRAASVLGIVGAGGIGYWFSRFFAWRNFPAATACLLMLLVVVVLLDAISTRLRSRLVQVAD